MRILFLVIGAFTMSQLFAVETTVKQVSAIQISVPIVLDGLLNEPDYQKVQPAVNFTQLHPHSGAPAAQKTEVYFFYDNKALYVGAYLHEQNPDSIFNFLSPRDDIGMSDYFGVYIDPYNQGLNSFGFFITPAGVQTDIKASKNSLGDVEDAGWNAVWESKTRLVKDGWTIEMRIPYSALRFPEKNVQEWGLNMFRNFRRLNSNNSWNPINRELLGFIHQQGKLEGIKNIKPPVRLSLTPYLATYLQSSPNGKSEPLYKGGLDLKYGINDAYTLDMMLVPDFGQVQSDALQLNLTPVELLYDDKRQFFTEGVELFNRGSIFYSRRIGNGPKFRGNVNLGSNDSVLTDPTQTQLINATKISGRNKNGLAVGVLNAMTANSNMIILDKSTQNIRRELIQPFTNYNVTVLDQSLANNSYVSLINTNMLMAGNPFYANVTATEFEFKNNSKTYALKGKGGVSNRRETTTETGSFAELMYYKIKGDFFWGVGHKYYSDNYYPYDMGYLEKNNFQKSEAWMYYQIIKPTWIINEMNVDMWYNYNRVFNPNVFANHSTGYDLNVRFKNNDFFTAKGEFNSVYNDYYESRTIGRVYKRPFWMYNFIKYALDDRKRLSAAIEFSNIYAPANNTSKYFAELDVYYRMGQNFNIGLNSEYGISRSEYGFNHKVDANIYFAQRNVNIFTNSINSSYILNNKMSIQMNVRHYWTGVNVNKLFLLENNGKLTESNISADGFNQNYNAFTLDLGYRWIFAPGSELSLVWKRFYENNSNQLINNYLTNLSDSWKNQLQSLSLKVIYYLDVPLLLNKLKK